MMDKKIKKAWLEALRSDEYHQGQGRLCEASEVEDVCYFCCLGVLIDIAADGDWCYSQGFMTWSFGGEEDMPPLSFLNEVGLDHNLAKELATDNDNGRSFKQIARKIEGRA